MTDKNTARIFVKNERLNMSTQDNINYSVIIADKILSMPEFSYNHDIYTYMSFRNEVNTDYLISQCLLAGKNTAVPKVYGEDMIFYQILNTTNLCEGYMGIKEPSGNLPVMDTHKGIIIVPGMVFDRKGNRAGYGKGFYDRYLAKNPDLIKIGIAFNFQIVDEIETNQFDIPMDYIITEQEFIKIRQK